MPERHPFAALKEERVQKARRRLVGRRGSGFISSTLDTEVWGNQWWNDPYVSQSYINFKVTRYEMADAFGVEFYSTEGDTLKVFSTGDVHFKPDNAERTVYINEQVEYEYEKHRIDGAAASSSTA